MSDILTASTSAYYYHKGDQNSKIRKIFIQLENQITKKEVRDSNEDKAKEIFSKKELYEALDLAAKHLSNISNFKEFVEAKFYLGA